MTTLETLFFSIFIVAVATGLLLALWQLLPGEIVRRQKRNPEVFVLGCCLIVLSLIFLGVPVYLAVHDHHRSLEGIRHLEKTDNISHVRLNTKGRGATTATYEKGDKICKARYGRRDYGRFVRYGIDYDSENCDTR